MDLKITFISGDSTKDTWPPGTFCVLTPLSWLRNVSAVHKDGERLIVDPPCAFELVAPVVRGGGGLLVSQADIDRFKPEWAETEEEFAQRAITVAVPADAKDVKIVHVSELEL